MAKVILKSAIRQISGRIGDVIYRTVNGQTYAYSRPRPSTKPPTPAQLAARARFATMARARAADVPRPPD